jgi:hypothetical protein
MDEDAAVAAAQLGCLCYLRITLTPAHSVVHVCSACRLLQEQMDEDAAAAAAQAVHRASEAGELATPGAYGSPDGYGALESPEAQTPGSSDGDGVTITADDAASEDPNGAASTASTADDSVAGANAKPGLEAASRDPSQSVSGSSGPVDSQNSEGKVVEQLSGGQTAGIVVGVLIAAGVIAAGVFGYQKYKKNKQGNDYISRYRRYDGEIEMH